MALGTDICSFVVYRYGPKGPTRLTFGQFYCSAHLSLLIVSLCLLGLCQAWICAIAF